MEGDDCTMNRVSAERYNSGLNLCDIKSILEKATVPEHSVAFMQAMSGGDSLLVGPYLFFYSDTLLLAVGYPLSGEYNSEDFDNALKDALIKTKARDCLAISPCLPKRLKPHIQDIDKYYILPVNTPIPNRIKQLTKKATASLRIEEGKTFTPAHQRLWAEFVGRTPLSPNVRKLYEGTEPLFSKNITELILLNAWGSKGELAACLLLDLAPGNFLSYILGAHSRINYTPYASDVLFGEMLNIAQREGKDYLHLGLGVNKGIQRFKTKWGGYPSIPYEMASWQEKAQLSGQELLQMLAPVSNDSKSRQQYLDNLRNERPFKMLWKIEKKGRQSWIGGTAHFFRYSFDSSMRQLFDKVDTVIFEGPLDQVSLDQVASIGQNPKANTPRLIDYMSNTEIYNLEKVVHGMQKVWMKKFGFEHQNSIDVRYYLSETRHWLAFFSLWTAFLRRKGWNQSVDLEAWHIAREMGKKVFGMELISEQIETLESIPIQRIVNFFRGCHNWSSYIKKHEEAYLKGNLKAMMGTSAEFPSRTEMVINQRDQVFLNRMLPFIQEGNCVVFVGSAHMLNLEWMIADAGFKIEKC